jgi:TctA family transporter
MGDGNPFIFFNRTVCRVLIVLLIVLLVSPWLRGFAGNRRARILATQGSSR